MNKLFIVTLEIEYPVLATDENDAKSVLNDVLQADGCLADYCSVNALERMPVGWENSNNDIIPIGKKAEKIGAKGLTLDEALKQSPKYTNNIAALRWWDSNKVNHHLDKLKSCLNPNKLYPIIQNYPNNPNK